MIEEATGMAEETLEFEAPMSVETLRSELKSKHPSIENKNFQIAVNQEISNTNQTIDNDAEIALLPPFAGG